MTQVSQSSEAATDNSKRVENLMFGDNTANNASGPQPFTGNQPTLSAPSDPAPTSAPAVPGLGDLPNLSGHQSAPMGDQSEVTSYGAPAASTPSDTTPASSSGGLATPSTPDTASTPSTDTPSSDSSSANSSPTVGGNDALLDIKQQALQQLTPLVDHLEQTPQEEFRTTMMMIQATDNQDLVTKAFEAAKKIDDDKERAQAFLDIINEINYFTQHHGQQQ